MNTLLLRFWCDQRGAVTSMELILIATIAVLGMIVGLSTYRNTVVQELGDSAAAMAQLNQGYSINRIDIDRRFPIRGRGFVRARVTIPGSQYDDLPNFGQPANVDPRGRGPMCIGVSAAPQNE